MHAIPRQYRNKDAVSQDCECTERPHRAAFPAYCFKADDVNETSVSMAASEAITTMLHVTLKTSFGLLSMAITFDPLSAIKIDPPTIRFYSLFALIDSFHLLA